MIRGTLYDLHRPPGDTGLAISPLDLDTVKLGRNQGAKHPSGLVIPDDREAADLLALVRDPGINLVDAAPAYDRSEEHLSLLLRGQHEHWMIVSKAGEEFVDGQSVFDFSTTHTRRSVEHSLKRLETECIELVLVYSDGNDLDILENNETYPTPAVLKREGLTGAYGLPGKTVEDGLRTLREDNCVMVTYSSSERVERPAIEYATAHAKGIPVKKVLVSGHACLGIGRDPVCIGFELVFDQPGVTTAVVDTINPLHLAHNIAMAAQALKKA